MDGPLGLGKRKSDTEIFLALPALGLAQSWRGAALLKLSGCCGKNLVEPKEGNESFGCVAGFC